MSVNLGIYDLFAYTIPGFLYIYVIYVFASTVDPKFRIGAIKQITIPDGYGLILFVLLLVSAHLLGHLFDMFAHWFVFHLFKHHKYAEEMLERSKKFHSDLGIRFQPKDRGLLFSMLRQRNMEHAHTIDSFEANSIMLRNISLGLFLLALLQIYSLTESINPLSITATIGLLVFSFVARQRSHMFHTWSLSEIFEASLRYGSTLRDVIKYDQKDGSTVTEPPVRNNQPRKVQK